MKIVKLKAQNIKNLKAIDITPEGHVVRLTGKNGAGKSAVLDTIFSTLTGKRLEDPIRHGEERAQVDVDMGTFRVRKVWTEKGERLEVFTADGDAKKSPQTFLNEVIGKLSFDPLEFKSTKPAEQIDLLKDLCALNFDEIKAEQGKVYDERTALNVKIKDSLAQLKGLQPPDPETPDEELTFKAELAKLNQLKERRGIFLDAVNKKSYLEERLNENNQTVAELKEEILAIERRIATISQNNEELFKEINSFVIPTEVTENQIKEVELALEDIEQRNVQIRAAARFRKLIKEGEKLTKEADALTQRLERLEQDKATQIANAKFPIEGLSFSDESVLYNGVPFGRLSTGQQIRVSTAIAMKINPMLKVILIREGSLLDSDGMIEILNLAKEQDYQVWIEQVDETGNVGFYIEDGSISKVNGQEILQDEPANT